MLQTRRLTLLLAAAALLMTACKKSSSSGGNTSNARLIFKFKFDSTQERLNNRGLPSLIISDNSAQSPVFNGMSTHYIEMARTQFSALGGGAILYKAPEVTTGGAAAIDFSRATVKKDGEEFFSIPLKDVAPATYEYLRISLAYQNMDIRFKLGSNILPGTVAGFIGFNTYIGSFLVKTQNLAVNANKLQGFWAFEAGGTVLSGQAPPGATTVPNPIFATSPIPAGSCVVTAAFLNGGGGIAPLVITGTETTDIIVTVSLSTNKSFEWRDLNSDGLYEPAAGDAVVDMGIRGMKPFVFR
jgi:hypothetical protein